MGLDVLEITEFCFHWKVFLNNKWRTCPFSPKIIGMVYRLCIPKRMSNFYIEINKENATNESKQKPPWMDS
jgi:hypothetical protein